MAVENFRIVLVRPRDPNNIGAVARVMKNFGFRDLAVVAPYEPIWDEAVSAVNAEDVLRSASVFSEVSEAVRGFDLVAGTVDKRRGSVENRVSPERLREESGFRKLAVLFGPEKTGLSNELLAYCNRTVTIPTSDDCPSMNLAQAAAVICYELARESSPASLDVKERDLAGHSEMEAALGLVAELAAESETGENLERLMVPLRRWLHRSEPSSGEIGMLCGLLKATLKGQGRTS